MHVIASRVHMNKVFIKRQVLSPSARILLPHSWPIEKLYTRYESTNITILGTVGVYSTLRQAPHIYRRRHFLSISIILQQILSIRKTALNFTFTPGVLSWCPQNFWVGARNFGLKHTSSKTSVSIGVRRCPSMSVSVHQCPSVSVGVRRCPSVSVGVRQCPSVSVSVRQCPSVSVDVRRFPSMSVGVRQCPSVSVDVRRFPSMSVGSTCLNVLHCMLSSINACIL